MQENIQYSEPEIREFRSFSPKGIAIAFVMGCLLLIGFLIAPLLYSFEFIQLVLAALSVLLIYSIFLFFLIEPQYHKEITRTAIKTIERPVIREVYVEKPVVKEVFVDKPIIKEVIRNVPTPEYREVVKTVYVEKPRKKLNIPKYAYLASSQTKVFHKRSCRLSKLIKKKYKISNNSKSFFVKKKFKACKICVKKAKKI